MFLLDVLLRNIIRSGRLIVIDAAGKQYEYGDGSGERVPTMRFHDRSAERQFLFDPQFYFGELYMNGRLTVEGAPVYDVLELFAANMGYGWGHWTGRVAADIRRLLRRFAQGNRLRRAITNVAHHYDLSGALYDLFLDWDRQYSCAFFRQPGESIDEAQANKRRHIAAKLLLASGQRILDIGSGWGGLALYLADVGGGNVEGITLSREQLDLSRRRAAEAGLDGRVAFALQDYREVRGTYDRIVSVGMFEHVGVPYYRDFFRKIRELLTDDGVALVHAIGRSDGPGFTNPWIRKYIFPGGYTPALSEVLPAIERENLIVTDIEILRLHYAETLRHWRTRFLAHWEEAKTLYDERFCRMWEFYLAGSEAAFRYSGLMVFQIQLAKRIDAVPLTRDYILDWERKRIAVESAAPQWPRPEAEAAAATA
jgi:cyclopropane-fatty-acyl-phospholipid synthase